jgi:hypothetical protein
MIVKKEAPLGYRGGYQPVWLLTPYLYTFTKYFQNCVKQSPCFSYHPVTTTSSSSKEIDIENTVKPSTKSHVIVLSHI